MLRYLFPSCWQELQPEVLHRLPQMHGGAFPFVDAVRTHGVGHLIEHLVLFDESVDQHLAVLIVHVIVARTMNQKQIALQTFSITDG